MASASSLVDDLMCSICLDVFTKPAAIPCGHNFCLDCITRHWDTKHPQIPSCPLCGETFPIRPMLRVNICIQEMAEKFKNRSVKSETGENEGVMCTMCAGEQVPALKSCLVCYLSLCKTHLEPHLRIPTLKKHKLIDPAEDLESRMCKTHHEALEFFCRNDQTFVCESCVNEEHKRHECVSFRKEEELRKAQLDMERLRMDRLVVARQQKVQEIQESMEASRSSAERAVSCCKDVTTTLVDCLQRSFAELTQMMELKQAKVKAEGKGFIKELEEEIAQISEKNTNLVVTLSNDPFVNVKNLLALTIPQIPLKDWSGVSLESETFEIKAAISALALTVTKEIRQLCDPDFKTLQTFAVDVTLDPDTANASLIISEDGKQISYSNKKTNVPNKPERFDHVLNVLAKQSFSAGKFYYEIQVKDKTQWDLGVAKESINRKSDVRLSPKNGFWTMWLRNGDELTANAGPAVRVPIRHERPGKIGVFVDYDERLVSFYDVDARALIYTFEHCNFTENIFPFFSPCTNDGGRNTAPLIITPVQN